MGRQGLLRAGQRAPVHLNLAVNCIRTPRKSTIADDNQAKKVGSNALLLSWRGPIQLTLPELWLDQSDLANLPLRVSGFLQRNHDSAGRNELWLESLPEDNMASLLPWQSGIDEVDDGIEQSRAGGAWSRWWSQRVLADDCWGEAKVASFYTPFPPLSKSHAVTDLTALRHKLLLFPVSPL